MNAVRERAGAVRYSTFAILLHWLIAAAIVLQVVLASRMEGPPTPANFAVTQLHKSIGITILLLSLMRLAWRAANPPPPLPAAMPRWEKTLSGVVHAGFYVIMIGMPLTGWLMVSASRIEIPTMLYGLAPWPHLPVSDLAPAAKRVWHEIGEIGHETLAKGVYVLLALHVAGALKHQLFSRDEPVLSRMAPGALSGRWLEPRLLLILLALVGVVTFGKFVTPPPLRMGVTSGAVAAAVPAPEPIVAQGRGETQLAEASASPPSPSPASKAGSASKAPVVPATSEPARWIVQPGSTLTFTAAWSDQPISGRFDRWRADILFGPEALDRSKLTVTIDAASINTGDSQRDAALPTEDWFDVAAHPKAVFTASRFEKTGADRYVAHGSLTLRGVTRPLKLPFRLKITGDRAEARGVTSLDRTSFGIGQGEWSSTDQIPAKVALAIDVKAVRK